MCFSPKKYLSLLSRHLQGSPWPLNAPSFSLHLPSLIYPSPLPPFSIHLFLFLDHPSLSFAFSNALHYFPYITHSTGTALGPPFPLSLSLGCELLPSLPPLPHTPLVPSLHLQSLPLSSRRALFAPVISNVLPAPGSSPASTNVLAELLKYGSISPVEFVMMYSSCTCRFVLFRLKRCSYHHHHYFPYRFPLSNHIHHPHHNSSFYLHHITIIIITITITIIISIIKIKSIKFIIVFSIYLSYFHNHSDHYN